VHGCFVLVRTALELRSACRDIAFTLDAPLQLAASQKVVIDCNGRGIHLPGGTRIGENSLLGFDNCAINFYADQQAAIAAEPTNNGSPAARLGAQHNVTLQATNSTILSACAVRVPPRAQRVRSLPVQLQHHHGVPALHSTSGLKSKIRV
jgi:hypothetical protein